MGLRLQGGKRVPSAELDLESQMGRAVASGGVECVTLNGQLRKQKPREEEDA